MVSTKIEDKYADKLSEGDTTGAKQDNGQEAMQIDYDAGGDGAVHKSEDMALCEPPYARGSLIRKFLGNTSSESPPNKRPRHTEQDTPSPTHASATTSTEAQRRPAIKLLPRAARGQWLRRAALRYKDVMGKGKASGKGKQRTKTKGRRQPPTAGKSAKGQSRHKQERNAEASRSSEWHEDHSGRQRWAWCGKGQTDHGGSWDWHGGAHRPFQGPRWHQDKVRSLVWLGLCWCIDGCYCVALQASWNLV